MSGRQGTTAGVDVGATLCKLARLDDGRLVTARFPSTATDEARACVAAWRTARVGVTGGGASGFADGTADLAVHHVGEFEAWARGTALIAAHDGVELAPRCLVVSLGTGTSILALDHGRAERLGGTGLGGGTMLGLGRLLLGLESFEALAALASRGDRRRVDLLLGDVYPPMADAPLMRDLTASNFARGESAAPADVAHALVGMIGETVALMAGALARLADVEQIVYCGSTLADNPALRAIVEEITVHFGHRPSFLPRGAWCGAVGAALVAQER